MITNAQNAIRVVKPSFVDANGDFHQESMTLYYWSNEARYRYIVTDAVMAQIEIDLDDQGAVMRLVHTGLTYAQLSPLPVGTRVYSVSLEGKHKLVLQVHNPMLIYQHELFRQSCGRVYRAKPTIEEEKIKPLLEKKLEALKLSNTSQKLLEDFFDPKYDRTLEQRKKLDSGTPAAE